jgi:aldose 1-epimerase
LTVAARRPPTRCFLWSLKLLLPALAFWASPAAAGLGSESWGSRDGQDVRLFTLTNGNGLEARITNYGAILVGVRAPDRWGRSAQVVQGFDSLADYTSADYLARQARYGAVLGRYANRIKAETYILNGVTYHRTTDGKPFDQRVWLAQAKDGAEPSVTLSLTDPDGVMGFPGTVKARVTYTLTKNNVLRLTYEATTDKQTIVNMTNHAYFNLAGSGTVLDHLLTINADHITPGDATNTPMGEVRPVAGTAFDFRSPRRLGEHIDDPDPLLTLVHGYGVNYRLNGRPGTLRLAARLEDPNSGGFMEEWTTQSDMQLYSGNYEPPLAARAKGYARRSGVALEAERAPNSPNIPAFFSPVVTPQKPLREVTEFRFGVTK